MCPSSSPNSDFQFLQQFSFQSENSVSSCHIILLIQKRIVICVCNCSRVDLMVRIIPFENEKEKNSDEKFVLTSFDRRAPPGDKKLCLARLTSEFRNESRKSFAQNYFISLTFYYFQTCTAMQKIFLKHTLRKIRIEGSQNCPEIEQNMKSDVKTAQKREDVRRWELLQGRILKEAMNLQSHCINLPWQRPENILLLNKFKKIFKVQKIFQLN